MSSPNGSLSQYYDRLSRYGALARLIGRDGGYGRATVHRLLRSTDAATDPADVIHSRIAALSSRPPGRLLDAGCGLGGTSFYFAQRFETVCDGVTLSPAQADAASQAAAARGLADRCRFRVASYDAPTEARYDLIVAIESLAHSADPAASLANLAKARAPGGRVVVVDDVRSVDADPADVAAFVAGWQAPGFRTRADWVLAFEAAGLRLDAEHDLTPLVPQRGALAREALLLANRAAALLPFAAWRGVLASHRGGLALERLYAAGGATYRLLAGV
ncbi:MAG: methyltransferase domain-containing protein [Rhodospirillales bacterium]|nr:methyltransferase domain-containing protein [Rhodospirillales bacterium]